MQPVEAVVVAPPPVRTRWVTNAVLFVITVATVLHAGAMYSGVESGEAWRILHTGWPFAVPLLAILVAHEFGHYIAARVHRVPASLPFFIPMPIPPFGTMGAVIAMKGRIASRKALVDIGASGPLAGIAVAVPVVVWGLLHSEVKLVTGPGAQEGQSLLYWILKRLTVGPIPSGYDVFLHPVAFAGWTGLFITMINLLPVGQLDGGHIAYALFGPTQNKVARFVHLSLPALCVLNLILNALSFPTAAEVAAHWDQVLGNSLFWLVWFGVLFLLRRLGGRVHPPTEPGALGPVRTFVGVASLVLFVMLFMITPMSQY